MLSMWVMYAMEEKEPPVEDLGRLRLSMMVRRVHQEQSSIGWENFLCGRLTSGLVRVQEWWNTEIGGGNKRRSRDPEETVVLALANCLLFRYKLWRFRCEEVLKRERPTKERCLLEDVRLLRGRIADIGASDRALFDERNVPRAGGDLERMEEWTRAVRGSIKRMESKNRAGHKDLKSYFGREWENNASGNEK